MNLLDQQLQIYSAHYERFQRKSGSKQKLYLPYFNNVTNSLSEKNQLKQKEQSQNHMQQQQKQTEQEQYNPPFKLKAIIFYLYFLQGIVISFSFTMPYVYKQLPSYDIMAIFSMAVIPFSFKFLIAPFMQKYSIVNYGKRKTWIAISQICISLVLIASSNYTDFEQAQMLAAFLFFSMFCCTFQDISLDGLAIKQLKVPHIAALLQAVGQTIGLVFGSLLLLKLTSDEFASSIGRQSAITTPSILMRIAAFVILIPTIIIHLFFKQSILDNEMQVAGKSFREVIKFYKIFINPKSRHCRTSIMYLIWFQGINFFLAGYEYELIKSGFSRNTLNTISNFALIPISALTCFLAPKINKFGMNKSVFYMISCYIALIVIVYLFSPRSVLSVIIITILMDLLSTASFLISSIITTSFPVTGVIGMYLTMLACVSNFGKLKTVHTKMLAEFGWQACLLLAIVIQSIILWKINNILTWVSQGKDKQQQLNVMNSQNQQKYQQKTLQLQQITKNQQN